MFKRGATKHCCWGLCNSDSRYPERLPEGTFFISFPKPGKIRDNMTQWERERAMVRTEKARRWQYLCGRADFQNVEKITSHTYICSLHFDGGKGPRSENDEPVLATLTDAELSRKQRCKRKGPTERLCQTPCPTKRGKKRLLTEESQEESSSLPEPVDHSISEVVSGGTSPECDINSAKTDDKATHKAKLPVRPSPPKQSPPFPGLTIRNIRIFRHNFCLYRAFTFRTRAFLNIHVPVCLSQISSRQHLCGRIVTSTVKCAIENEELSS